MLLILARKPWNISENFIKLLKLGAFIRDINYSAGQNSVPAAGRYQNT